MHPWGRAPRALRLGRRVCNGTCTGLTHHSIHIRSDGWMNGLGGGGYAARVDCCLKRATPIGLSRRTIQMLLQYPATATGHGIVGALPLCASHQPRHEHTFWHVCHTGRGALARGHGVGLFAFGDAYWPLATAHSDPLWVRTCFGCVNGAPG